MRILRKHKNVIIQTVTYRPVWPAVSAPDFYCNVYFQCVFTDVTKIKMTLLTWKITIVKIIYNIIAKYILKKRHCNILYHRCEVSGEAPLFQTATSSNVMIVVGRKIPKDLNIRKRRRKPPLKNLEENTKRF